MRTLLKVTLDAAGSNKAISDGTLPKIIKSTMERINPKQVISFPQTAANPVLWYLILKIHRISPLLLNHSFKP